MTKRGAKTAQHHGYEGAAANGAKTLWSPLLQVNDTKLLTTVLGIEKEIVRDAARGDEH